MMGVKRVVGRIGHIYPLRRRVGHIYPLRKMLVERGCQDKVENKE